MTHVVQNFGLIGTRGHYRSVVQELANLPKRRLAACAFGLADDEDQQAARSIHLAGHRPRWFDDWRKMIADGEIDALIVCGPFEQHAEMCVAAIANGIHVLCEKPLALNAEDLERVREVCAANPQVHLACMMFSRYAPGFFTAHELVSQGRIGEVRLINARKSYRLGERPDYYRNRETYGGTLLWVGSHAIDWSLWMLGDDVQSVQAIHSVIGNNGHGDLEATGTCQIRMANDAIASISVDMLRTEGASSHGDDWIRIVGTRGTIEARPDELLLTDQHREIDLSLELKRPMQRPVQDFITHAEGEGIALNTRGSALAMTEVCLAVREAADQGRTIKMKSRERVFSGQR